MIKFLKRFFERNRTPYVPKYLFSHGDIVKHVKSGKKYRIIVDAWLAYHLEKTNEIAYIYREVSLESRPNLRHWIRCAKEMEDGRFKKIDLQAEEC